MPCISCGRPDNLHKINHIGNLQVCAHCFIKHDTLELAKEADRLLTEWFLEQQKPVLCLVCANPVLRLPDGSVPMWCQACEVKRKAYVNARA